MKDNDVQFGFQRHVKGMASNLCVPTSNAQWPPLQHHATSVLSVLLVLVLVLGLVHKYLYIYIYNVGCTIVKRMQ